MAQGRHQVAMPRQRFGQAAVAQFTASGAVTQHDQSFEGRVRRRLRGHLQVEGPHRHRAGAGLGWVKQHHGYRGRIRLRVGHIHAAPTGLGGQSLGRQQQAQAQREDSCGQAVHRACPVALRKSDSISDHRSARLRQGKACDQMLQAVAKRCAGVKSLIFSCHCLDAMRPLLRSRDYRLKT